MLAATPWPATASPGTVAAMDSHDPPAPGAHALDLDAVTGTWIATTASGATYALDTDAQAIISVPPGGFEAAHWDGVWVQWESIWAWSQRTYDTVVVGDDIAYSYWLNDRPRMRRSTPVVTIRQAREGELAALPPPPAQVP